jgi:hypothetical protein
MGKALALSFLVERGCQQEWTFLGEGFIIRSQRKKKKRCISANQEGRLFLYLGGGGIE